MGDISKINVGQDYNIKDPTARAGKLNKNANDSTNGIINFLNGLQIGGKAISVSANEINFDSSADWVFPEGHLKYNGYAVLTVNDINPNDIVGKKYKVSGNNRGEIVGDYTNNIAEELYSFVTGAGNESHTTSQLIGGKYNDNKSADLFEIGNGTDSTHRSNALEVKTNGDVVCGDLLVNNNRFSDVFKRTNKRKFTNTNAINVTTSNTTLLNETLTAATSSDSYCLGCIPITMETDGNVIITVTTNLGAKTYKKYCLKGSDLINFICSMNSGVSSIKVEIKTEYIESEMKKMDAKLTSIYNYLMSLSWVAPISDNTNPAGILAASSVELVLIGV